MKKLLYIVTQGEYGGAQKNVFDLATSFKDEYDVYVYTGSDKESTWLLRSLSHHIDNNKLGQFKYLKRNINLVLDIKALFEIRKFLKQNNIDILHLHSSKAGVVGSISTAFLPTKSIYTVHGYVFKEPMGKIKRSIYIGLEFVSSLFNKHNIVLTELERNIGKKYKMLRGDNSTIIYNGLADYKYLDRDMARSKILEMANINYNPSCIIGSIANLYPAKALHHMIDIAHHIIKNHPEALFIIIGEGALREELERQIDGLGLSNNFKLVGAIDDARIYLKSFDIYVMTSVKEGMPYALVEASRANLPIISSSVGGIKEMSQYINIQLIENHDIKVFVNKILEVINNIDKYKSNSHKIFDLDVMIQKVREIYKRI